MTRATGAQAAPDVIDEQLDPWEVAPLTTGFAIEHAHLGAAADLAGLTASRGRIGQSRLDGVPMTGSRLRSITLLDVVAKDVDASNADWTGARLRRVVFEGCRMTGFGGPEMEAEDVLFRNCRLHLASFRYGRIRRTTFENCLLDEADFAGASLMDTRFAGSQVRRVDFGDARLVRVDFRGSVLDEPRGNILGLRGAIIDPVQLVGLAATLAQGVGIVVEER
jgi:uncharacterized protein YjbI with pentapeptide repeats